MEPTYLDDKFKFISDEKEQRENEEKRRKDLQDDAERWLNQVLEI